MDEDILSPALGRLIDAAKAAAPDSGAGGPCRDGVALLTQGESVFAGQGGAAPGGCAAADALAAWAASAGGEVVAAAVAQVGPGTEALPCAACRRVLGGIDADLPLVLKRKGRWVMNVLTEVPAAGGRS